MSFLALRSPRIKNTLAAPPAAGVTVGVKVWDGGNFVLKPVKVWDGGTWVAKPVKVWNGTGWVVKG